MGHRCEFTLGVEQRSCLNWFILLMVASGIQTEKAISKIQNVFVGEELRGDLVEAVAALEDDAGVAQNGKMFRNQVG